MAVAYKLGDGLHELQLPDGGTLKTALSPERIEDLGYDIQDKPKEADLRLAKNDFYGNERGALANSLRTEDEKANASLPDVNASMIPPESGYDRKQREASNARDEADLKKFEAKGIKPIEGMPELAVSRRQIEADANKYTPEPSNDNASSSTPSNDNAAITPAAPSGPGYAYGAPRYGKIKGGDKRVSFTRTAATPGFANIEPALADASIDSKLAAQQAADVETASLNAQSGQAGRDVRQAQNEYDTYAAQKAAHEQEYRQKQAAIDKERADVENLKVDPNRWWANKSTGGKIMAVLSMMAGGALQGMGRTKNNPGYDMIRQSIQDDIDEQKARRQMRLEGLHTRQTEFDRLVAMYGSPALAEKELQNRQLAVSNAMAKKLAIDSKVPEVQARLSDFLAQSDRTRALEQADIDQKYGEHVAEQWANIPDRYVQTGGMPALKPEQRERVITYNNGQSRGFVVAGNARDKVQSAVTGYENLTNTIGQLRALAAQASTGNLDAQRAYNSLRSAALTEANVLRGQGAMSEGDQKNIEAGMPDVSKLTTTRHEAETKLKEQEGWSRARLHSTIRDNVYLDPNAAMPAAPGDSSGLRREE